jgi:hypothetical protein
MMPLTKERFQQWVAGSASDDVLRWVLRGLVGATLAMLVIDITAMQEGSQSTIVVPPDQQTASPGLVPSILAPLKRHADRLMPVPDGPALSKPMIFDLAAGGRLMATGTITPGISKAFADEIEKRGDYIKTVVFNSPGGSVQDALAIGRLIRTKKFNTEVEAVCASSCPLAFAGGVERKAAAKAAIGVHQVFAAANEGPGVPRDGMNEAQRISAQCQRYLSEMGISLEVWVHAMETPKDRLFVFKPEELKSLNLVTASDQAATALSKASVRTKPGS